MSHQSFLELHDLIKHDIQPGFTNYRDSISTVERLLITLMYLATGTSFQHIGYNYRVSHNHAGFIVEETCRALLERLKPICLPTPDRGAWERIGDEYYRLWNFPHCIGAIDGKREDSVPEQRWFTVLQLQRLSFHSRPSGGRCPLQVCCP